MAVKNVQVDTLSDSMKSIYTTVRDATGVAGIGDEEGARLQIPGTKDMTREAMTRVIMMKNPMTTAIMMTVITKNTKRETSKQGMCRYAHPFLHN